MSRPLAVVLGICGALLCGVTLAAAYWQSSVHISTGESIAAGFIAAVGLVLMMKAFVSTRSVAVIVFEVVTLLVIWRGYALVLSMTSRSPTKHTMADLRTIATALEARATDVNEYPAARDIDDLARYLEPTYIRHMPRQDAFRNAFRYQAWQIDPHNPGPDHYAIASAGHDWKWEKESLREYSTHRTHDPDCDIVYSDGTFVVFPQGAETGGSSDWPTSTAVAGQGSQQTTTDPKAVFDEATMLYRAGRFSEAVPLFEKYLGTAPNDALANARIGMSLGQIGRLQDSIPYLLKAAALDPTDYQSRSNLGLVYERLNRPEQGIDWERQADRIKPNDPAVLNNLGWVLLRAGRRDEAIEVFERLVRLAPKERPYRENLERARSGKIPSALPVH